MQHTDRRSRATKGKKEPRDGVGTGEELSLAFQQVSAIVRTLIRKFSPVLGMEGLVLGERRSHQITRETTADSRAESTVEPSTETRTIKEYHIW